ncbi:hypothetical protein KCU83_g7, partial [Aureobasidium melanogenum]
MHESLGAVIDRVDDAEGNQAEHRRDEANCQVHRSSDVDVDLVGSLNASIVDKAVQLWVLLRDLLDETWDGLDVTSLGLIFGNGSSNASSTSGNEGSPALPTLELLRVMPRRPAHQYATRDDRSLCSRLPHCSYRNSRHFLEGSVIMEMNLLSIHIRREASDVNS